MQATGNESASAVETYLNKIQPNGFYLRSSASYVHSLGAQKQPVSTFRGPCKRLGVSDNYIKM